MASNPYVNKVVYGNQTLIDITDTTAVASDVASGKYFYNAAGAKVQGTASGGSVISVVETQDSGGGTIVSITAVDLTNDTVTADKLLYGYTAHDHSGTAITGTYTPTGGGLTSSDAILKVNAPSGSTVIITKNGTTITGAGFVDPIDSSIYNYYFIIDHSLFSSTGWTVTATSSVTGETATAQQVINAAGVYEMSLSYGFYLFKSGVGAIVPFQYENNGMYPDEIVSITTEKIEVKMIAGYSNSSVWASNSLDLTPYKLIHAMIKCTEQPYDNDQYGLRMWVNGSYIPATASNPSTVANTRFPTNSDFTEYTIDVTNINSSYLFGIWGIGSWECTNIWLTN